MNYRDCKGCHKYSSPQGGCQAESCWMEEAHPHGKGCGRRNQKARACDYQWCGAKRKDAVKNGA